MAAAKAAAYRLLGRATVTIQHVDDQILCAFEFPPGTSEVDAQAAVREFKDEVLDQDLRERISEETAPLRNAILAHAFSRTGLQD